MDSKRIRGIGCLLRNDTIYPFLRFITQKRYACFAPWCLKSDNTNPLPQPTKNIEITDQTIQDLEDQGLWELVLHIYPYNVEHITIET